MSVMTGGGVSPTVVAEQPLPKVSDVKPRREEPALKPKVGATFLMPNGIGLGGVSVWALRLSAALKRRGRDVTVISHQGESAEVTQPVPEGIRHLASRIKPWSPSPLELRNMSRTCGQTLPGILIPAYSSGLYGVCARLAEANPEAVRVIGYAHSDTESVYRDLAHYEPIIHRFVAVSESVRIQLMDWLPVSRWHDIRVRPYSVDLSPLGPRSYTPDGQPLRIVYGGRLVEGQKRISRLPQLAAELLRQQVDFELVVAGSGADESALRRRLGACTAEVRKRVRLIGRVPSGDMSKLWRTADVGVLTSDFEGVSISMLESMAAGAVPVSFRVSGTPMMVEGPQSGLLAPPGSIRQLAEAIARLHADRSLLAQLGARARATVEARCTHASYWDWFEDLLDEVWEDASRPWLGDRPVLRVPTASHLLSEPRLNPHQRFRWIVRRILAAQPRLYAMARWVHRAASFRS